MKNLFLVMISGGLCISSVRAASILAGPIYNPATTHSYFLLGSGPWTEAEATAQSMGGHLVTVNDAAENNWLLSTFSNFGGQARALWTGLNDAAQEGVFVWSSGELVSYTNWEAGEPDNGIGFYPRENYVLIWPSPGPRSPGYWNDYIDTNTFTQFSIQVFGVVEIANVNNWTNPFSAKWESSSWSLGKLPAADQVVSIVNDGYKAVNIDNSTVSGFASSLTVGSLIVGGPTNGLSTLLLNFFGVNTPLKVLDSCAILADGTIDNFSSSFEVDGNAGGNLVIDGGTFTQVGGLTVVNAPVLVRSGSLNATNANLTLGDVTLGTTKSTGNFNQDGGSIAAQHMTVENGRYTLSSGTLYAIGGTELDFFGEFLQWGGTNYGDITVNAANSAAYTMAGGLAQGNVLTIRGSFYQGGGLVDMQTVDWTGNNGNVLNLGTLRSKVMNIHGSALVAMGQVSIEPGNVETESLSVSNSAHVSVGGYNLFVTNNLDIGGDSANSLAYLTLISSMVRVGGFTVHNYSHIEQYGPGSTELNTGLNMLGGEYLLEGGLLEGPYLGVDSNAVFSHHGGTNLVHGVLSVVGAYDASYGTLVTDGIYLRGSLLLEAPPEGSHMLVINFTNNGLIDLGGRIGIGTTNASGGQVRLSANAVIDFIGTPAQIRFSPSSTVDWTSGALLVISNWNNSGNVHIFFGPNSSGLSSAQLRQIVFTNPGGFTPGNYPAQLLSTGELVPAPRPTLLSTHSGSALVMSWPSGYQLLSATNVNGPYTPVSGASSPRTNSLTKPQEFFRLQAL